MKKAKKFISLFLAIIMIVLTAPMAFAGSYDFIGFGSGKYPHSYLSYMIYSSTVHSCYCLDETHTPTKIREEIDYLFNRDLYDLYPEYIEMMRDPVKIKDVPQNVIDVFYNNFKSAQSAITDSYERGETLVNIDTERAIVPYFYVFCCHTAEEIYAVESRIPSETKEKAYASVKASEAILDEARIDPKTYTQVDYNEAAADMIDYYTKLADCLNNKHLYGDTATDNGDDTHTYTCSFCSETYVEEHWYDYEATKCGYCGADKPEEPETPESDLSDYVPQTFFEKVAFFFINLFIKLFGWLM